MDNEAIRGKRIKNFDYLVQVSAEERFSIIEEVLNETLKPFTNINFKPDEHNYFISLKSDWTIKKEED